MRINVHNDFGRGGWFIDYEESEPLPFLTYYTGPFASRGEALKAIPEYQKVIAQALASDRE